MQEGLFLGGQWEEVEAVHDHDRGHDSQGQAQQVDDNRRVSVHIFEAEEGEKAEVPVVKHSGRVEADFPLHSFFFLSIECDQQQGHLGDNDEDPAPEGNERAAGPALQNGGCYHQIQ